ncbi:hypothetical protein BCR43DRAFT_485831 [Syncephalastrum racemosum]|uniref:NAD-dependent epimerase/dehydratase domain-containing protein n=1 Tax=Syncephalastrum racemosum TaxID=13706 RepID=A0A1X2HPJ1_SYNRA|nr:hypothetical protein BCR43DRAFT_485831 [Syncephalastrum racemosum]
MSTIAAKKILVVGGSGFLGLNICKFAARQGWETVSLSRKGEPSVFKHGRPAWAEKVEWAKGDSLEPASFEKHLEGVTDVVQTVGIISESDYKDLASAQSFCDAAKGMSKVAGGLFGLHDRGNPMKGADRPTFEKMNRDTAITVAKMAAEVPTMDSFVYISASDLFPFVDPRYISTKRDVERYLFAQPEFRSVVLRPGLMYGGKRPTVTPIAMGLRLANTLTKPIAKELDTLPFGTAITTPPLHIDTVAQAVTSAIEQKGLKGIFDVEGIQKLAYHNF